MLTARMTPHQVTVYGPPAVAEDAGGGVTETWPTVRTSGLRCLVADASAAERQTFAQQGMAVTTTIGFFETGKAFRGDKVTDADGRSYHVKAINETKGFGRIRPFTLLYCEALV